MEYHIAQMNIAKLVAPLDDPRIEGFTSRLDEINEIAERSKGFIWRMKDEHLNNATSVKLFDSDLMIVNISVWESIEYLKDFAFRSEHMELFRKRKDWFEEMAKAHSVLWWVKAGYNTNAIEAVTRLKYLRKHGPSKNAFSFRELFAPPSD